MRSMPASRRLAPISQSIGLILIHQFVSSRDVFSESVCITAARGPRVRQPENALDTPSRELKTQGVQLVSDLLSPSALDDPYECYAQLRLAGPVQRVPGTDFY